MVRTAGIVLAGGRSSRMGTSKSLLRFRGMPLIEHMQALLRQSGLEDIFISGEVPGFDCIPDATQYDGPAQAMCKLLHDFASRYERLLFVPVDMPLISTYAISVFLEQEGSVFYTGYPLPACLVTGEVTGDLNSVRDILAAEKARGIPCPVDFKAGMANINTQEEWKAIAI